VVELYPICLCSASTADYTSGGAVPWQLAEQCTSLGGGKNRTFNKEHRTINENKLMKLKCNIISLKIVQRLNARINRIEK